MTSYELMGEKTDSETALWRRRLRTWWSTLDVASDKLIGGETDSWTARPAGREDVVATQAEGCAEKEWLVQYLIKRGRTPEVSIVSRLFWRLVFCIFS